MPRPRILTFNFHEPYLCLMARTGYDFAVAVSNNPHQARPWRAESRPLPPNLTLMKEPRWRADLAAGRFDLLIAHNEANALDVFDGDLPKILVCHNRRTFLQTTASPDEPNVRERYIELLVRLIERFQFVFISESKRADYGFPGVVIPPGIDVEAFGGYTGEVREVLRVGNFMRERDLMFDVDFQERVCAGLPNRVVGVNPRIPGAREARSFDELLDCYRTRRCLFHVTREAYEDGHNLAMIEAMACGMPVVALANATSPLTDGLDGFVADDADILRNRIENLLNDLDAARTIGGRGRETVARKFPIAAFVERWRQVIEETAATRSARRSHAPPRQKILLQYLASPITTARYFEYAARKKHVVVTTGFRCPEQLYAKWGFNAPPPAYPQHDVHLPLTASCRDIVSKLPESFAPDLYLWIDSGPKAAPADLDALPVPKACYLIDTHLAPDIRLDIARHFDFTFLAQKAQVDGFRNAGIPNVQWLPLACSPELHDLPDMPRIYDIAYVGGPEGDPTDRRRDLLRRLRERFPNSRIGRFWPNEMARIYAQAKIVVNACVNRDVNMRVFEGMASGALLITDEADGLEDLFEDGKHLVIYRRDEDLFDMIERYLQAEEARTRIAAAGAALVRSRHTYDARLDEMLSAVRKAVLEGGGFRGESRFYGGGYYRNPRPEIAQFVPLGVQRLLDVGCGCGDFGRALKQQGVKEVHGIEIVERAWYAAKQVLDGAILGSIEQIDLPFNDGYFDCIVFADVLEHLADPVAVLRKAAKVLAPDGIILMSIPNVRFYEVLAMLANGRWHYADAGILDRTHLRFFTAPDMALMVQEAGLELLHLQALSFAPEDRVPRNPDGSITLGRAKIWPADDADYHDLLTYQYLVIAGKQGGDRLMKARDALGIHEDQAAIVLAQQARGVDEYERQRIIGAASARLGQLTHAEAAYREALRLKSGDPAIMAELGILLVAMNRAADAKPYLQQALASGLENDRAVGALGLVHLAAREYGEALNCFRKALEAGYENAALIQPAVQVAEHLNRLPDIEDPLCRYADFYPGNADIACACATVLIKLGKHPQARDRLETLLLLAPGCEPAQALLSRIAQPD